MCGDVRMQGWDGILLQGKINAVMDSPAFLPSRCASGNQGCELKEVSHFEMRATRASLSCRRQGVQSPDGLAEISTPADGPYVFPHNAANLAGQCRMVDGSRSPARVTRVEGDVLGTGRGCRSLKARASFDHGTSSTHAVHQAFQQGIAGQAVGPMKAIGSYLAGSVQTLESRGAINVGGDATYRIMCCRAYGNQIGGDVNIMFQTGGIDSRKKLLHALGVQSAHIQIDEFAAAPMHLE